MADANYTDIEMCRCLTDFDWNLRPIVVPRSGGRLEGVGDRVKTRKYAADFTRHMLDLKALGCAEEIVHVLLHHSFDRVKSPQYPARDHLKELVSLLRKAAREMREAESTGFLWIDDAERYEERIRRAGGTEDDVVLSRFHRLTGQRPSILALNERRIKNMEVRAKHYTAWLNRSLRRRVDLFDRLPGLLLGLYVHQVTGEINAKAVTELLNATSPPASLGVIGIESHRESVDVYRREVKAFEADCPRALARLKLIFGAMHLSSPKEDPARGG